MSDPTTADPTITSSSSSPILPRITIQFCTQCKWMLRAAYFAQELLSTFSTALGEVALQPATGGVFIVEIVYQEEEGGQVGVTKKSVVLWDRKVDGGFPETKELKRRVRDVVWPGKGLGHVDRDYGGKKEKEDVEEKKEEEGKVEEGKSCKVDEKCENCE
ncbi:seleno protein domain protein [Podospora fimiseda]|uniref:Seleno protein domain protein n=1 Tax=Podospora fimiseda TaxID=252190 RepID=A0AAN7BLJ7_9PEZI|nr:seleno protein domain protein [Podospora fimiseda]